MKKGTWILILFLLLIKYADGQRDFSLSKTTKVVMLGTGTPNASPGQSGCSVAIVVNDEAYIFDFGPGLIRRAAALSPEYGGTIKGLSAKNLKHAFLTHLHSDHTAGFPDLILTPWVLGRDEPLELWGPEGIKQMTDNIIEAYAEDIKYRIYGDEPGNATGWRVNCNEIIKEGLFFEDSNIKVEAFPVLHGTWPNAWGFRVTTPDRKIVISGDTRPTDKIVEYATGADVLIHEVYSEKGFVTRSDEWKKYHYGHHTSTIQLGEMAARANPEILVLYHILAWGATEEEMLYEISMKYKGKVVCGRDLDIF